MIGQCEEDYERNGKKDVNEFVTVEEHYEASSTQRIKGKLRVRVRRQATSDKRQATSDYTLLAYFVKLLCEKNLVTCEKYYNIQHLGYNQHYLKRFFS